MHLSWSQGDFALVSASVWPDYPCEEQGGRGWLVQLEWVAEAGGQSSAKVRFVVDEEYEPQELDVSLMWSNLNPNPKPHPSPSPSPSPSPNPGPNPNPTPNPHPTPNPTLTR